MTIAVAVTSKNHFLRTRLFTCEATLSGSYATPGEVITADTLGLKAIFGATASGGMGGGTTGFVPVVELTGTHYSPGGYSSMTLRFLATGASSGAIFAEMADGAYSARLTALPIILMVNGRGN